MAKFVRRRFPHVKHYLYEILDAEGNGCRDKCINLLDIFKLPLYYDYIVFLLVWFNYQGIFPSVSSKYALPRQQAGTV
jgi:hypothetical protein